MVNENQTSHIGFVNPKGSTLPCLLPAYQRPTVGRRSCISHVLYAHPPPLADGTCLTVHHSTANLGISDPDRCTLAHHCLSINRQMYIGGVTC